MNSIIVVGNKGKAEKYIEEFIQTQNIKPYYIDRFSEGLKISQVRDLKKKLAIKLEESQSRLFVIEGAITTEAQNALLKTFEESASWAYFIVCVSMPQDLLPTILSRCHLVFLEHVEEKADIDEEFKVFGQDSYELLYSVFEKFQFFATIADLESFIFAFRLYIKDAVLKNKPLPSSLIHRFVKICEYYPLIKSNNINRKTALETAIIVLQK